MVGPVPLFDEPHPGSREPARSLHAGAAPRADRAARVDAETLARVLDCMGEGAVLVTDGEIVYRNAAAARLLASEGDALADELHQLARRAARGARIDEAGHAVATTSGRLHLRASHLGPDDAGAARPIVVTIARAAASAPPRAATRRQANLTAREASVARLVARGYSNARIAAHLRISESTARHYTESVFLKLGVHTRAAAVAVLLAAAPHQAADLRE